MFEQLLKQLALGLERIGIAYMVIGGQAVLLYGEPRLTRDIDLTLGAGPDRLPAILALVKEWAWQTLVREPASFVERTLVLPCLDLPSGIRIDFIFSFSPYEQQAIERARRVDIGGTPVRYASAEDLVIHKIIAGRPRDLEDVRSILLKIPDTDTAYIRSWLEKFEQDLQQPFLERFEQLRLFLPSRG